MLDSYCHKDGNIPLSHLCNELDLSHVDFLLDQSSLVQDIRAVVDKSHLKYSASHPIRIVETQKAPGVIFQLVILGTGLG